MPREKVGAHVRSHARKRDFVISKKKKTWACVDPATTLIEYAR
jgi:hypothetical protein